MCTYPNSNELRAFVKENINFANWILFNNKRSSVKLSLVLCKVSLFKLIIRCVIPSLFTAPYIVVVSTTKPLHPQWFTLKLNLGQGGILYWELPLLVSWFWWMPITLLPLLLMLFLLLLLPLLCERATVKHENRETWTTEWQERGLWFELRETFSSQSQIDLHLKRQNEWGANFMFWNVTESDNNEIDWETKMEMGKRFLLTAHDAHHDSWNEFLFRPFLP